jgi:hypothetical protein
MLVDHRLGIRIMRKLLTTLFVFFAITLPASVAFAQDAVPEDPSGLFVTLFEKIQGGEWLPAFGASLMLLVFLARKGLSPLVPWFKTKLGGSVLAFGLSLAMAAGTALLAGQTLTLSLAATALGVAWAAGGGWENFKDLMNVLSSKEAAAEE